LLVREVEYIFLYSIALNIALTESQDIFLYSIALNIALTESQDNDLIEFNSGHVGLMIGKKAQPK
jgi:hypothetical protein